MNFQHSLRSETIYFLCRIFVYMSQRYLAVNKVFLENKPSVYLLRFIFPLLANLSITLPAEFP